MGFASLLVVIEREEGVMALHLTSTGGIAPNQVIARSEFEVHRQIYTE